MHARRIQCLSLSLSYLFQLLLSQFCRRNTVIFCFVVTTILKIYTQHLGIKAFLRQDRFMMGFLYDLVLVVVCLVALACVFHSIKTWYAVSIRRSPPIVTGPLPFLGCAIEFGKKKPALFIKQCIDKVRSSISHFAFSLFASVGVLKIMFVI